MSQNKKPKEERLLGTLVDLSVKSSSDFPSVEFHANFKIGNNDDTVYIALPSINTEFILGFLGAMGFVNRNINYGKNYDYQLRQDLLLLGYDNMIKSNRRYKLKGKLCWLIRESCICQPYLIEPLNPEDGKPFNIIKWKEKKW